MLKERELFGEKDLVKQAITRLKVYEFKALEKSPEEGYYVAFSGGKDSIVILDLVRRAGVKHKAYYNITTVDPPELTKFINLHYQSVTKNHPKENMWQLIERKMIPPTRMVRYCCQELKEASGRGRVVVTGIRWAESSRRAKRKATESCFNHHDRFFVNPIIEWEDSDVWEYIRERGLPYCSLYDDGFKRIGCIGCPMSTKRKEEFERYPFFANAYRRACDKAFEKRVKTPFKKEGRHLTFKNGAEMFDWWMEDHPKKDAEGQRQFDFS